MTEQQTRSEEGLGREVVAKMVAERVIRARKEEVLETYEDLLSTIWNRIVPTLGQVTVLAIIKSSLALTEQHHHIIGSLVVTGEGMSFDALHQRLEEDERDAMGQALKELIANIIDILAMLTGDVLVRQLLQQVERRS